MKENGDWIEINSLLLDAIQKAKADEQKWQERREQRFWRQINFPMTLAEAVNTLTKSEMDKIRKKLDLKNLSALKKADLAAELVKWIPVKFKQIVRTLDQGEYGLLKLIADNGGAIFDIDMSVSKLEVLLGYSLVFPGIHDNRKVLYMPAELLNIFIQYDHSELEKIVRRNTEWILLTRGMLYYYGVADTWVIKDRVQKLTGSEIDFLEFMNVNMLAIEFYEQIRLTFNGFCDIKVFDPKKIVDEHRMRPGVDYYPFSRKQLLKAGDPEFIDWTPAMTNFIGFLRQCYDLNREEADEIAKQMIHMINADSKPSLVIEYLQSWFEFPSFSFVQSLTEQLMYLQNNTRQWVIKGHTPRELFEEEKKHMKPLPPEPFNVLKEPAKVIEMPARSKIGRNDPCPCGSGLKYKKCCGK